MGPIISLSSDIFFLPHQASSSSPEPIPSSSYSLKFLPNLSPRSIVNPENLQIRSPNLSIHPFSQPFLQISPRLLSPAATGTRTPDPRKPWPHSRARRPPGPHRLGMHFRTQRLHPACHEPAWYALAELRYDSLLCTPSWLSLVDGGVIP